MYSIRARATKEGKSVGTSEGIEKKVERIEGRARKEEERHADILRRDLIGWRLKREIVNLEAY